MLGAGVHSLFFFVVVPLKAPFYISTCFSQPLLLLVEFRGVGINGDVIRNVMPTRRIIETEYANMEKAP